MKVALECTGCRNKISLPGFKYRARIKKNPNYKPYCSYRCAFPTYTDDPTKKYCTDCKNIKSKTEFNVANGRYDKLTPYCIVCTSIRCKDYRERNPNKVAKNHKKRRWNRKIELFKILEQTKCTYCEFSVYAALQFEHKNGNGANDKLRFKNLDRFYKYYIEHPEEARKELQITCANCNWIKRFTYEEYRHVDDRIQKISTQDN